jgi:L-threonylcarbamoyladenylate synthase
VGVLASHEVVTALRDLVPAELLADYGAQGDLLTIASRIYELLISFNDTDADVLLGEGMTDTGLGLAIMNRLHKASGFHSLAI